MTTAAATTTQGAGAWRVWRGVEGVEEVEGAEGGSSGSLRVWQSLKSKKEVVGGMKCFMIDVLDEFGRIFDFLDRA